MRSEEEVKKILKEFLTRKKESVGLENEIFELKEGKTEFWFNRGEAPELLFVSACCAKDRATSSVYS